MFYTINMDHSFQTQLLQEQELVRLSAGRSQVARCTKKDLELIQACRNFNRTTIEQFISTVLTLIDFGKKSDSKKKSVANPKKETYFFPFQILKLIFILLYLQHLNSNTHWVVFSNQHLCEMQKKVNQHFGWLFIEKVNILLEKNTFSFFQKKSKFNVGSACFFASQPNEISQCLFEMWWLWRIEWYCFKQSAILSNGFFISRKNGTFT